MTAAVGARPYRLAALGDSITCGEGVGLALDPADTWVAVLAAALPGTRLHRVATAGARVRDVRTHQLPAVLADPPELATVLAGLNDVIRGGFDPAGVLADLAHVVAALRSAGTTVVLATVFDPMRTRPVPLPGRIRRQLSARAAAVNAGIRAIAAADPGVVLADVGDLPGLAARGMWAVDRAHPGPAGHRLIAAATASALARAGWPVETIAVGAVPPPAPAVHRIHWLVRHGLPWLVGHGGRLGPVLASMPREPVRT